MRIGHQVLIDVVEAHALIQFAVLLQGLLPAPRAFKVQQDMPGDAHLLPLFLAHPQILVRGKGIASEQHPEGLSGHLRGYSRQEVESQLYLTNLRGSQSASAILSFDVTAEVRLKFCG